MIYIKLKNIFVNTHPNRFSRNAKVTKNYFYIQVSKIKFKSIINFVKKYPNMYETIVNEKC